MTSARTRVVIHTHTFPQTRAHVHAHTHLTTTGVESGDESSQWSRVQAKRKLECELKKTGVRCLFNVNSIVLVKGESGDANPFYLAIVQTRRNIAENASVKYYTSSVGHPLGPFHKPKGKVDVFIVPFDRIYCTVSLTTNGYLKKKDEDQVSVFLREWGVDVETLRASLNHNRRDKVRRMGKNRKQKSSRKRKSKSRKKSTRKSGRKER